MKLYTYTRDSYRLYIFIHTYHILNIYIYNVIRIQGLRERASIPRTLSLSPRVLLFVGLRFRERRGPLTSVEFVYYIIF